ncbi:hypothetical protein N9L45_01640 [Planctomycetota bacterium]|nr:hypothetical protein [Planctomycetota bacterium]
MSIGLHFTHLDHRTAVPAGSPRATVSSVARADRPHDEDVRRGQGHVTTAASGDSDAPRGRKVAERPPVSSTNGPGDGQHVVGDQGQVQRSSEIGGPALHRKVSVDLQSFVRVEFDPLGQRDRDPLRHENDVGLDAPGVVGPRHENDRVRDDGWMSGGRRRDEQCEQCEQCEHGGVGALGDKRSKLPLGGAAGRGGD